MATYITLPGLQRIRTASQWILGVVIPVMWWAAPSAAQPWDLATEWSNISNPMGQFTVGIESVQSQFVAFTVNTTGTNDSYFGLGSPAWVPIPGFEDMIPGLAQIDSLPPDPAAVFDVTDGAIAGHTPDGSVNQGLGHVIRWTAPNTETVNVAANLWDIIDQSSLVDEFGTPTPQLPRAQRYEFRHNGTVIQRGGILLQEQGFNSAHKMPVVVPSLAVQAGDTIDLFVARSNNANAVGDFVGHDLTISQGISPETSPDYFRSMAADFVADYGNDSLPQNNPNGDWTYLAADDTTTSLVISDGGAPVGTAGVGPGWAGTTETFQNYGRPGGPFGYDPDFDFPAMTDGPEPNQPFNFTAMAGHGPQKIVWTAPDQINLGNVELAGFLQMDANFQPERQSRLRIYKNNNNPSDTDVPLVDIEADFSDVPGGSQYNEVPFSGVQVPIQPGDTLTTIIDGSGSLGNGTPHFGAWDVIISEILLSGLPGDFNGDLVVNAADYTIWRDNLGATEDGNVLNGSGDGGTVEQSDYLLWKGNFGLAGTSVGTSIPEPASSVLLATFALGGVIPRNRFLVFVSARFNG